MLLAFNQLSPYMPRSVVHKQSPDKQKSNFRAENTTSAHRFAHPHENTGMDKNTILNQTDTNNTWTT